MEARLMIAPPPCRFICSAAFRQQMKYPPRWLSTFCFHELNFTRSIFSPQSFVRGYALFTRQSILPCSLTTCSKALWMESSEAISIGTYRIPVPSEIFIILFSSISAIYTVAPNSCNAFTISLPRRPAPPVTTATLFSQEKRLLYLICLLLYIFKTPPVLVPLSYIKPAAPMRVYTDFIPVLLPYLPYKLIHIKVLIFGYGIDYFWLKNIGSCIDKEVYLRLFIYAIQRTVIHAEYSVGDCNLLMGTHRPSPLFPFSGPNKKTPKIPLGGEKLGGGSWVPIRRLQS